MFLEIEKQRQFFASGATLPLSFRIEQLKKLKSIILDHENEIVAALKKDLRKSATEALSNEILLVIKEIDYAIKNLKKWSQPQKVSTPIFLWPGKSKIHFEPYGCVLIIGPWNYPFLLILSPLIGAISAGNCAIIKPSELAPHSENLIVNLINKHFLPEYLYAVKGGSEEVSTLLNEKFDYIFFTGSTAIAKKVMAQAAKNLTPVTLELGGKSPCIIDETADLDFAARRIIWAKTLNAGQICVAPDYIYVHQSCREELILKLQQAIKTFYGESPEKSSCYARIINQKHFERLSRLMQQGKIIVGGDSNANDFYIAPTLIDNVSWQDPIMQEEIFGPLLPILTYHHLDEIIPIINSQSKPLALYLFTKNKNNERKVLTQLSFGGGCVNDCIVQVANSYLPFGGIGSSGMGAYHGKHSFETFSHRKSIYKKTFLIDSKLEYPPYSARKLWWIRKLMKL